ncbi:leucine-rich repeat protein [Leishmania donovani]|uniref:Leucine-rich_repeat_protein_putative/GeneDB:LmjF. 28.2580 n=1 Tax=Leishmania donovani TaxID=5661 RepID=A0A6J8FJ71_LEIDO|nr:leucine-rich repeat protein [Leishmania donovani]VDZ46277.1 leucine-rich_repeat_protein_putative/GeneDB:LmjF.28.2580 [Leishmania donovani]
MLTPIHGVMDLSFAPGKDQELSDLPFERSMLQELAPEEVRELNVTHAQMLSLTSTPGALINDVLRYVTVLRAAHNHVSSLHGIEAFGSLEVLDLSHNCLRVVDAHGASLLRTLKQLRTVDFSYNNMNLLDLNVSAGAPSSRLSGLSAGATPAFSTSGPSGGSGRLSFSVADPSDGLLSLTAINLSHNAFIDLPDLRSAPHLQVLNMGHNKLDALAELDTRLPLLSLHSLALHSNQLRTATVLLPLCALAATLKHTQVFRNPFTLAQSRPKTTIRNTTNSRRANLPEGALDESMWWRPFLLWLCPLLVTVDQAEFTASERRVAAIMLFRENGSLSKSRMEYMNPQRKDDLEAYLRRNSELATPPHDAMAIIDNIERQEESLQEYSGVAWDGDAEGAGQMVVPTYRMNPSGIRGEAAAPRSANGTLSTSPNTYPDPAPLEVVGSTLPGATPMAQFSRGAGGAASRSSSGARVVVVAPEALFTVSPSSSGVLNTNRNRQRVHPASMTSFVRALQRKLRSIEEVVAVLWHADLSRRTRAAIVIQRVMRGALARMHLSEEDAESCRFIRYQLQQATAASAAQAAHVASGAAAQASGSGAGGNDSGSAATRGVSQRHPSLEPVADTGSNMQEVLVSMRSLQEVMSNMWADLEEYRAMADREQRRAAVLIQRYYRGYRARCEYGRALKHHRSLAPPPSSCAAACRCASETACLRKEVSELRSEVRELRALLQQTTRQQRLAAYDDPERAMDEIIRKHEQRSNADILAEPTYCPRSNGSSQSPSDMPSLIERAVGGSASAEKAADDIDQDPCQPMTDDGDDDGTARTLETNDGQLSGSAALSHRGPVTMSQSPELTSPLDSMYSRQRASMQTTRITKLRPNSGSIVNARQIGKE